MDFQLREVSCQKACDKENFSRGLQDFNFNIGGASQWLPQKSFFKITTRLSMCKKDGNENLVLVQPLESDQISLSDNHCAALYDNVSVKGGGQDISTLNSYAPQCHQMKQRLSKSKAWLDSMGKDVWGCNPSFKSRVNSICSDTGALDDLKFVNVGTKDHEVDRTIYSNGTGTLTGENTDFDGSET